MEHSLLNCTLTHLREISRSDFQKIVDWINDPEFNKLLYQGWKPLTIDDFTRQIENEQKEEDAKIFSQFEKKTNELVGWCGIYLPKMWQQRNANKAELRTFVGNQYWKKGYGTEQYIMLVRLGFEQYHFNRLYFGTHQNNIGTQKIYEKLGFTKEGVLRQDYRRNDYADIYLYSVLKIEYDQKVKKIFDEYLTK